MMKKYIFPFFIISVIFISYSCKKKTENNNVNTAIQKLDITHDIQSGNVIPCDTFYINNESSLFVTVLGHASLMLEYEDKIIYVDPYSQIIDYSKLPKADLILITHEHFDHFDTLAINQIKQESTHFITSKVVAQTLGFGQIINNDESTVWTGLNIDAVPAYNIVNKTSEGEFYHPKGRGNGYILTIGDKKIYIAGDTENIPEMEKLNGKIEIAFLPQNLPYTMNSDMFVDAALKVKPKYLYTYHCNQEDLREYKPLIAAGIKQLIRPMSNK